jgi:hypothetical protein
VRHDLEHRLAGREQPRQRRPCLARGELAIFHFERVDMQRAGDHQLQHVGFERLLEEIVGAKVDRLDRVRAVEIAGDDDHLGERCQRQDLLQRGQTLGGAVHVGRQSEVEQHHRRLGRRNWAIAASRSLAITTS